MCTHLLYNTEYVNTFRQQAHRIAQLQTISQGDCFQKYSWHALMKHYFLTKHKELFPLCPFQETSADFAGLIQLQLAKEGYELLKEQLLSISPQEWAGRCHQVFYQPTLHAFIGSDNLCSVGAQPLAGDLESEN